MLSKEEIEAFMDDAEDFDRGVSTPPQTASTPWTRGVRAMTLTSRAQWSMMRNLQQAMNPTRW